jgi:hypothetical protein
LRAAGHLSEQHIYGDSQDCRVAALTASRNETRLRTHDIVRIVICEEAAKPRGNPGNPRGLHRRTLPIETSRMLACYIFPLPPINRI